MEKDQGKEQTGLTPDKAQRQIAPLGVTEIETNVPGSRPFPGFGQAILLILSLLILQALLSIPFVIIGLYRNPVGLTIPTLIGTAAVLAFGFSKTGAKFREVFPFAAVSVRVLLSLFLTVIGLLVLRIELAKFLMRVVPPPKSLMQLLTDMIRGGQITWTTFLVLALIIPIGEELFFRGLILYGFLLRYRSQTAILASALLFSLMHGNPWQFATGVSMGILLAWCLVKTHSLIPCFFAHIANNSIGFVLPGLQRNLPVVAKWMTSHPVWVDLAGLSLAVSGICLLKWSFAHPDSNPARTSVLE